MRAYLTTFASTHAAMAFEASFAGRGALVPVPPALRAGCGMAWRFVRAADDEALREADEVARAAGLAADDWQLFAAQDDGFREVKG